MAGWLRTAAYWVATVIIAWEMTAGSLWDLLQVEYVRVVFAHLNYPLYLLTIIGVWKFPCAVVLLIPRVPWLKEWAYAGAFFNYSGASASHLLAGDAATWWGATLGFAVITLVSWVLRPPHRRITASAPDPAPSATAWLVAAAGIAALVASALLTLPQGPPRYPF